MLAHARGPACLGKPDEAIDVLRTGVAGASSSSNKADEAALLLAWSDVEAAAGSRRHGLVAAVELAARAAEAAAAAAEGSNRSLLSLYLRLAADDARLRSSLALSGDDDDGDSENKDVDGDDAAAAAADAADAAAHSPTPAASASAAGMTALLAHSQGDAEIAAAAADAVIEALRRIEEESEEEDENEKENDVEATAAATLASLAASRAAAVRLASGDGPAAIELYSKAIALAEKAQRGKNQQQLFLSPLAVADASLAALSGRSQARTSAALPLLPPPEAERDAGDALSSFDAEKSELCLERPEAAASPLLLVLAQTYATSGRVMVAEGLFRRGGQLLGVLTSSKSSYHRGCVHPSVAAALAWRHSQLLTALPKRGKEANELAEAAGRIAAKSFPFSSSSSLEASLGTLDALTGKGSKGKGVVVDAAARRVLPWLC